MIQVRERGRGRARSPFLFGMSPSVGNGGAGDPRNLLTALLGGDGLTVADYDASIGITGVLNASAWANQIGAAGPLLQATGANQPIVFPFAGQKYAYLPAVASNTLTSPNLVVTGTRTISFNVALNDYSPAADVTLIDKTSGNDGFAVKWLTTDKVRLVVGDGVGLTNVDMAAATTLTDATQHTISIAWADGVGATFSIDGVASAQVAAVKTLTNAAVVITVGSATSIGKVYSVSVSGLYGLNAADWSETSTNGATQVSSTTGETWTLNNTGALPAQIVASASLLFDGTADYLKADAFTLNQPVTIYLVGSQVTWTPNDYFFDGNTNDTMVIYQATGTPKIDLFAGNAAAENAGLALNTKNVITAVYNGANSSLTIGNGTPATGNPGAGNPGGFTLGSNGAGNGSWSNIQIKRIVLRAAADSAAVQSQIQSLLRAIYGTPA